jgi:hypothetical protein
MQQESNRRKIAQGLVAAVCLAGVALGIGDMLRSLRKHS